MFCKLKDCFIFVKNCVIFGVFLIIPKTETKIFNLNFLKSRVWKNNWSLRKFQIIIFEIRFFYKNSFVCMSFKNIFNHIKILDQVFIFQPWVKKILDQ